jgi:polysaccharide export outer membrane protein
MEAMKNRTRPGLVFCGAAALVLFLLPIAGRAQDTNTPKPAETPQPAQLKLNTYDPPETVIDAYRIGVGDVLEVTVTTGLGKSPQLSADNLQVNEKGLIQVFDGTISAECLTAGELAANLKTRYLQYKKEPLGVVVNVKEYRSQIVAVIGAVKAPGRFELRRPIRLLELLALYANGPQETSDGRIEVVHTRDTTCEGNGRGAELTMASGSYKWEDTRLGREDANPYVRPGDVISLSEAPQIFVIGNVREPKAIPLRERVTLTTAIAMAGGTLDATKSDAIRVERQRPGSASKEVVIVNLSAIKNRQAEDLVLQAGDIVDVPASTGGKIWRGLLSSIVPTLSQTTVRVIH